MMTDLHAATAIWGAWRARQSSETADTAGYAGMLANLLELDLNWVDHADIYDDGAVEALHGEATGQLAPDQIARLRLISKCGVRFRSPGQPGVRVSHYRSDAAFIRQQAEASLTRLRAARLDLYLLHRPDYLMQVEETARALEDLRTSGKIAAYGASNFSTHQWTGLRTAAPGLAAHQIEFSVLETTALDDGRRDQARQDGVALLAWSPLGGGRLFDETDPVTVRLGPALDRLAAEAGLDRATLALAWVKHCGVIPVLGSMRDDRLRQQVEGLRAHRMDNQSWYEILEAARGQRVP